MLNSCSNQVQELQQQEQPVSHMFCHETKIPVKNYEIMFP